MSGLPPGIKLSMTSVRGGSTIPPSTVIPSSMRQAPSSLSTQSLATTKLDDIDGRYNPLKVPSAQKVLSTKKSVLDRSISYALLPKSYSSNTSKESALLEYAEDFRRQFVQVFPERRPLPLCPLNECRVRKFLPTTIRPSLLPYNDLYDLSACAEFVSDYVTYMQLDEPTRLPDLVPATDTMLQVRRGDCLDMSILLVSLLRGAGYNAFVVAGYAPEWITTADQSQVKCPLLPDQEEIARKAAEQKEKEEEEERKRNKYEILAKPEFKSRYRAAREQEKRDAAAQLIADEEARIRKLKEKAPDPLHGQRAHAWVLVSRGRRDVTEEVFVEATTGTIYPVSRSPYLAVDAVWNEQNYWVNVQMKVNDMLPIPDMSWDLSNGKDWEYVLIDEKKYRESMLNRKGGNDMFGGATAAASSVNFEAVNEQNEEEEQKELAPEETFDDRDILDAPMSWSRSIHIDRDLYLSRYPDGYKFVQYKDCTLEKWSPYSSGKVGLVRKLNIYEENKTLEVREPKLIEVWETFQHRKDKLHERHTFPLEQRVVATYHPGLSSGLKSYSWIEGQKRVFTFYPGARVDGLVHREETLQVKVVEQYEGRDDYLIYRSIAVDTRPLGNRGQKVTFLPLGPKSIEFPIRKLTEKYARNPKIPAEADVRKRTHFLTQNTIRLDFHYGDHHITHSTHLLDKNDKLEQSETEGRQPGSVGMLLRVDPSWKERSRGEEQQMVAKLLLIEKELKLKLKAREEDMIKETIKLEEELDDAAGKIILEKSIYDVAYEQAKQSVENPEANAAEEDLSRFEKNKVDYLTPFLAQFPSAGSKPLTRRQAQQVKDECLAALKERLLERANIIQQHLDEETQKLHQRQSLFKRQAGSGAVEASEEFNRFSNQCLFRIDILNARRARHEELALKKYVEMDERLNNDPRLAALHQQE